MWRPIIFLCALGITVPLLTWGLPDAARTRLLTPRGGFSARTLSELDSSLDSYLDERERADEAAASALRRGAIPRPYTPSAIGPFLGRTEQIRTLRRYLLGSCAVDERETYVSLARMGERRLNTDPHGFIYGGAYVYPVGAGLYLMRLAGLVQPTRKLSDYLSDPAAAQRIYLSGRLLSLIAFLGTGILLARLGTKLDRPATGTLAMIVWYIGTLPLNQSLISKPHVWAAFWLLLGIDLALPSSGSRDRGKVLLSGVAFGLAVGSSLMAITLALPVAFLAGWKAERRRLWSAVAVAFVAFATVLLTNPYMLIHPEAYLATIRYHGSSQGWSYAIPGIRKLFALVEWLLVRGFPFPLGLLGFFFAIAHARPADRVWGPLAIAWLIGFALMGLFVGVGRISLFLGPLLCLFAAAGLARLFAERMRLAVATLLPGMVFALLFFLETAGNGASYGEIARLRDAGAFDERAATGRSSDEGAPETEILVGVVDRPEPRNLPPLPFTSLRLVNLREYKGGASDPAYVVLGLDAGDMAFWKTHPLFDRYRLVEAAGYPRSFEWFPHLRTPSEARLAAWIFEPVAPAHSP